ncbi:Mu-like prophage I protein [compost metagenome]
MANKKLFQHAFSAGLSAAPTKTIDGKTLHALPILPASPFRPTDSRSGIEFSYDAEALVALYRAKGRRIVLDIEHNTEGGQDTRARGWSVDFTTADMEPDASLEPGVLYGWFELTPLGAQEIADKLYGYTSGVALGAWLDESHVLFTRIKSLALTNNPATEMPMAFTADGTGGIDEDEFDVAFSLSATAAYTAQQDKEAAMLAKILEQLGLAADADEATVVSAVAALTAAKTTADEATAALTAAGIADVAAVATFAAQAKTTTEQLTAAQGQLTALTAELAALKASAADQAALAAVDAAVAARKITPAQRDAMLTFARADSTAFSAAMAAAPAVLSDKTTQAPAGAGSVTVELTAEDQDFLNAFGFKAESLIKAKQQVAADSE